MSTRNIVNDDLQNSQQLQINYLTKKQVLFIQIKKQKFSDIEQFIDKETQKLFEARSFVEACSIVQGIFYFYEGILEKQKQIKEIKEDAEYAKIMKKRGQKTIKKKLKQKIYNLKEQIKLLISRQFCPFQETVSKSLELISSFASIQSQYEKFLKLSENKTLNRSRLLSLEIKQEMKRLNEKALQIRFQIHEYCYNFSTLDIYKRVLKAQKIGDFYEQRLKVIKTLNFVEKESQKPKVGRKNCKFYKIARLKRFIEFIDCRIQEFKYQFHLQQPVNLRENTQKISNSFSREIMYLMYFSWIMNLYILYTDKKSFCLQIQQWGWFTLSDWMTGNAWGSLAVVAVMVVYNLTIGEGSYNDSVHDGMEETFGQKFSKYFFGFYEESVKFLALISVPLKLLWILIGIVLVLTKVEFFNCSDNLLNLLSLEFLAFFTFGVYKIIFSIFSKIQASNQDTIETFPLTEYEFDPEEIDSEPATSVQTNQNTEDSSQTKKNQNRKLHLYISTDNLEYYFQKILIWSLAGWVYDFVLYRKDHSDCITAYSSTWKSFHMKNWLFIDGIANVTFFGLTLLFSLFVLRKRLPFTVWHKKCELYHIELVMKYWIIGILFFGVSLFKFTWTIIGLTIMYNNMKQTLWDSCNTSLTNFLLIYFSQALLVSMQILISVIKGYRMNKYMKKLKKQEEEEKRLYEQAQIQDNLTNEVGNFRNYRFTRNSNGHSNKQSRIHIESLSEVYAAQEDETPAVSDEIQSKPEVFSYISKIIGK